MDLEVNFRRATRSDVPAIVQMLAADKLGRLREKYDTPLSEAYYEAFDRISGDPNQELMVVEHSEGGIVGTLQLSFIQYLTYEGGLRAQVEAVIIREDLRGQGLGKKMFQWTIGRARARGAHVLQLTTDKRRPEALRFYEQLGFRASHEGMKLYLD